MLFSLMLYLLRVLSLETDVCSVLKFLYVFQFNVEYKVVLAVVYQTAEMLQIFSAMYLVL